MKSTREGYGDVLVELGNDRNIVVLDADLSASTYTNKFAKEHPERFFQCGVAEQNMVGMAVGFALSGKTPFVSTFAAFVPSRALDHIRVSVCYNNANVKLASTHAGLTVGEDGATHQAMEDIAALRALPNMKVIVPADYEEAKKAVKAAADTFGPFYIRLGRNKLPEITSPESPFEIGKANVLREGTDVSIIACGIMVSEALKAAEDLEKQGVSAEVINNHSIKPLDYETILNSVNKTGCVVTAEEHQINGGLGSTIAEFLVQNNPVPQEFVAVHDTFGESGKPEELMEKYGLTSKDIVRAVKKVLGRKV